jgi:hypothetical protein
MSDVEQSSTSKIELLLLEEAKRDLEMEYQGTLPFVGEMQRLYPAAYKASREFLSMMSVDIASMALSIQQAKRISEMIHSEDEGLKSIQDVLNMQPVNALTLKHLVTLERKWRAKENADLRHDRPGGSRDNWEKVRAIWASGKYTSREKCAIEECEGLGMSYDTARKALRNTPAPLAAASKG